MDFVKLPKDLYLGTRTSKLRAYLEATTHEERHDICLAAINEEDEDSHDH
jgi:hypothetical protein